MITMLLQRDSAFGCFTLELPCLEHVDLILSTLGPPSMKVYQSQVGKEARIVIQSIRPVVSQLQSRGPYAAWYLFV